MSCLKLFVHFLIGGTWTKIPWKAAWTDLQSLLPEFNVSDADSVLHPETDRL